MGAILKQSIRTILLASSAIATLALASATAQAGGFALREQSAAGQGASFAGIAAGGALSSMFWNPATITQFSGKTFEAGVTGIFPSAAHSYSASTLAGAPVIGALYRGDLGNSGDQAIVPNVYGSWQLSPDLWLGLSVNAPFGLGVSFPTTWAGAAYAQQSSIRTYNTSPTIAYKFNDWLSVAAGVQVQYMQVQYGQLVGAFPATTAQIGGAGFGYGFTLGATITPTPTTQIGIGYRSAINQKINGNMTLPGAVPGTPGSVNTTLNLPDMITVGLRQGIGDRFTLLAGFEWSGWSRIGTANLLQPNGAPALIGAGAVRFPFNYSDGFFYSLGGEYKVDPQLTLRAGIAFEKSPITDVVRTPRLPDNDRMWYSVGASYKPAAFQGLTFDLGYSFIDVKNTPINISAASGNPWFSPALGTYIGSVSSNIHILSVAMRYQWDADPAPRRTHLVTK